APDAAAAARDCVLSPAIRVVGLPGSLGTMFFRCRDVSYDYRRGRREWVVFWKPRFALLAAAESKGLSLFRQRVQGPGSKKTLGGERKRLPRSIRRGGFLEDEEKVGAVGVRRREGRELAQKTKAIARRVLANQFLGNAMAVVVAFAAVAGLGRCV